MRSSRWKLFRSAAPEYYSGREPFDIFFPGPGELSMVPWTQDFFEKSNKMVFFFFFSFSFSTLRLHIINKIFLNILKKKMEQEVEEEERNL